MLGGAEEVGRNCTILEYKNDIIIIDLGLEFPNEEMPGVDYIIPNMSYLKGKEKNIRGVIITHGHYDHIGAIPHTVPFIGNPPIFALPVGAAIVKRRQTDFQTRPLNIKVTKITDVIQLGQFKVSFFHINHNIPDSAGIIVETPVGTVCHTGDWKFDFHPTGTEHADFQKIAEIGKKGLLCLMGDSTNSMVPGHQISEKVIGEELERIIEKAKGRIIFGTFASLLSRVKQIIEISEKLGKKVVLDGFSMKTNVEIAKELGFIKVSTSTLITMEQIGNYPQEKIVVVCTGAQGEKNAALNRIASDEHRAIRIDPTDTVVFSSSVIPGNENAVQRLKDIFYRKRAHVIHKDIMDVHAGGHAFKEDIKLMLALFKPKYYVPIEGNHFMLRENASVAYSMGWKEENVFVVDNGQVMEFWKEGGRLTKEKVPAEHVFVDGLGVGDVSHVVLRDRKALSEDGMVVVVVKFDAKSAKVVGTPDIISHGFIFAKDQKELIDATAKVVEKAIAGNHANAIDPNALRDKVRDEVGNFLFARTERRPMVVPVLMEL
ncbi:MAG: ribonuclease J [Actinobacteria bacterium]|nr:ribonuclease J [Actinomycetota bacterium]